MLPEHWPELTRSLMASRMQVQAQESCSSYPCQYQHCQIAVQMISVLQSSCKATSHTLRARHCRDIPVIAENAQGPAALPTLEAELFAVYWHSAYPVDNIMLVSECDDPLFGNQVSRLSRSVTFPGL